MNAPQTLARKPLLSIGGWFWLIYWSTLFLVTLVVVIFFYDSLDLSLGPGRGRGGRGSSLVWLFQMDWAQRGTVALVVAWVLGALVWLGWWRVQLRSQGFSKVCESLGLKLESDPTSDISHLPPFPLFEAGTNQSASDRITGTHGEYQILAMDYSFTMDRDMFGSTRTYSQTVVIFFDAVTDIPDFQLLRRDTWWTNSDSKDYTKKGQAGDLKIGKKRNVKFANLYQVAGDDKDTISDFFTAERLDYFVAHSDLDVEVSGGNVLVYREMREVKPHKLAAFLKAAADIVEALRS
jgi:hypothetical protein